MIGPSMVLALMLLVGPDAGEAGPPVATTRGGPVMCEDLLRFAAAVSARQSKGAADLGSEDSPEMTLKDLVVERQLIAEAEKAGLARDVPFVATWQRARGAILVQAIEQTFADGVIVSEGDLRAEYKGTQDRYVRPERISTRFILLRVAADADRADERAAREKLRMIRDEYLDGSSFVSLARQYSEAENAARGGAVATSPRGTLLEAYETVAWQLKEGEVSDIVRLPDGFALILLEKVFPPIRRGFEEARRGIHERVRRRAVAARRDAALAEARVVWPVTINREDLWSGKSDAPIVRVAERSYSLEDLGLGHRPPRLEERVNAAVEDQLLVLLAEKRGLDTRRAVHDRLARVHRQLLIEHALDRLLAEEPQVRQEKTFQAWYSRHRSELRLPEHRSFAAVVVIGEEGRMRLTLDAALEVERAWRAADKPPGSTTVERWGPLERAVLGNSISPRLARTAFSLGIGEVSPPLLLERYAADRARYIAEGYVVLRLLDIEPGRSATVEEARRLYFENHDRRWRAGATAEIRARILDESGLQIDGIALADCLRIDSQEDPVVVSEPTVSVTPG